MCIKKMISLIMAAALSAIPYCSVTAIAEQEGEMIIIAECDEEIEFNDQDEFTLKCQAVGEEDGEDLGDTKNITIKANEYVGKGDKVDIESGIYKVIGLTYNGNNGEIITQGYGCSGGFIALPKANDNSVVTLVVGDESVKEFNSNAVDGYIVDGYDAAIENEGRAEKTETNTEEGAANSNSENTNTITDSETTLSGTSQNSEIDEETEASKESNETMPMHKVLLGSVLPKLLVLTVIFLITLGAGYVAHKRGRF